ncbi:TPA: hypothetical protein MFD36_000405 [Klebsiella pneumoniae]|uniref:hypothetical protein n=1 Tax=Klebsiella pneumoniae TaxID=573 RepID=UPI000C7E1A01|nr:hypothetical protein [Klebsiella pneumoniae]EIX9409068.1 hypothetical protein [Klebsiella pneumoniae]MCQ8300903.1 hypothetical protein [Klebsiella pneumoniae]PLJ25956.1 hypothetical protein B6J63_15200 [Klebsiella pneumoniae]TXT94464.1 hypothetical protein D4N15_10170 [Klebsiella pneumoniae]VAM44067.1 Uncharacterised protein [Klebsiella pneumoniae]
MPKFDEIRNAVTELRKDSDAYWDRLYNVMDYFERQLLDYWGIHQTGVMDNNGKLNAVFVIGIYDQEKQVVIQNAPFMLPKDGRKLCFDILLNLPEKDSDQILIRKVVRVKFRHDKGSYLFEWEGVQSEISCSEIDGKVELKPFFDALHNQLLSNLRFSK